MNFVLSLLDQWPFVAPVAAVAGATIGWLGVERAPLPVLRPRATRYDPMADRVSQVYFEIARRGVTQQAYALRDRVDYQFYRVYRVPLSRLPWSRRGRAKARIPEPTRWKRLYDDLDRMARLSAWLDRNPQPIVRRRRARTDALFRSLVDRLVPEAWRAIAELEREIGRAS